MSLLFVCSSSCLVAQGPLATDPPSITAKLDLAEERVKTALSKLSDGTAEEKVAAEKELLEIGPRVLLHLPAPSSSATGDFRDRLIRIRDALQSQAINEYAQPSTITLSGNVSAADVLLELMDQSDNQLNIDQLPNRLIDVHFSETPFWEALDQVLDKFNLDIGPQSRNGSLQLIQRTTPILRSSGAAYAGVFRFEPLRLDSTRTVLPSRLSNLSIALQVAWEPRLKPVYFHFPMEEVSAECDNGEILTAASPDSKPEYSPSESSSMEASMMMTLPSRDAKKIVRLNGSLVAAIPGAPVQMEFEDLEAELPKTESVGKLQVTLLSVGKREEIYECKLKISLGDAGQTMDSFRGWLMSNEAYVVDSKGKRINNAGWNTNEMNSEAVGLTYFFELGESTKGFKLIYVAPGAVSFQQIDFLLKDIPLP